MVNQLYKNDKNLFISLKMISIRIFQKRNGDQMVKKHEVAMWSEADLFKRLVFLKLRQEAEKPPILYEI